MGFVIFASDGIWGPLSDHEAVRIVASGLREGGDQATTLAAQQLVEEAHRREGHDDKTAVVVWFGDMPHAPAMLPTTHSSVTKLAPRQVLIQQAQGTRGSDDMFAIRQPLAPPKPPGQDVHMDDLFASYARSIGMR